MRWTISCTRISRRRGTPRRGRSHRHSRTCSRGCRRRVRGASPPQRLPDTSLPPPFRRATRSSGAHGPRPRRSWSDPSTAPHVPAMTHFARALGAARTGALDAARADVVKLGRTARALVKNNDALLGRAGGHPADGGERLDCSCAPGNAVEAERLLRTAADREDATEKSAVTPGPLAPARESLGDLLHRAEAAGRSAADVREESRKGTEPSEERLRRRPRRRSLGRSRPRLMPTSHSWRRSARGPTRPTGRSSGRRCCSCRRSREAGATGKIQGSAICDQEPAVGAACCGAGTSVPADRCAMSIVHRAFDAGHLRPTPN